MLKEEALSVERDCLLLNVGQPIKQRASKQVRERNAAILGIVQRYDEMDRLQFLRAIGHRFNI